MKPKSHPILPLMGMLLVLIAVLLSACGGDAEAAVGSLPGVPVAESAQAGMSNSAAAVELPSAAPIDPIEERVEVLSGRVDGEFDPDLLQDHGIISNNMIYLLETRDPDVIQHLVSPSGLVIAPYGVGAPDRGLTGAALADVLEALFSGSSFKILKFESTGPGQIGMIATALNEVEVLPAIGDRVRVSGQAYLSWRLEDNQAWKLWLVAVDPKDALIQALDQPPFDDDFIHLTEAEHAQIATQVLEPMAAADIDSLARRVVPQGLVIAPYGSGSPGRGLTGSSLHNTLAAVFAGANPQWVTYFSRQPGILEVVVTGLNQVEVAPAAGEPLDVTDPALTRWVQGPDATWQLWMLVLDSNGLLVEELERPKITEPGSFLSDEAASEIVREVAQMLAEAEVEVLAGKVREKGLVFVPYAVGSPDQGLTGEALTGALEAIMDEAEIRVEAYANHQKGRLSLVLTGLTPVQIQPAVGDPLQISSPAILDLQVSVDGEWELWAITVDQDTLLSDAASKPPFKAWK